MVNDECVSQGISWRHTFIIHHSSFIIYKMSFRNSISNFKWKRLLAGIGGGILVVLFVIYYFNYMAVYSEGNRAGKLIKFSKKGWLFKTYEGELNQGGVANPVPGTAMVNQIWKFSVKKDAVADELMKMEGKECCKKICP